MEPEKADKTMEAVSQPKRKWRRAIVTTSVLCGMVFTGVAIAPIAVMNSSFRDSVLDSRLKALGLTATSASGSGSWVTPFEFRDILITDETGRVRLSIESIVASKSLAGLIFHGGDLGTFTVTKLDFLIETDEDGNLPLKMPERSDQTGLPTVAFDIHDAAFQLVAPWRPLPVVDLQQLEISGTVATLETGRWLSLDRVQVFDHEQLSDAHTQQNLALIAPVLAQTTALDGKVSVVLDETRIRLDGDEKMPIRLRGDAVFHSVEAKLRKEWAAQISQMIGGVTGQSGNSRLQVARDSAVHFQVSDKGVYHEGLVLLLPDLASRVRVESSGVVGLDENLDLTFGVQLPQAASGGALMSIFSKIFSAPLRVHVRGTVSEPKLEAPVGFSIVDQLSRNVAPEQHTDQPPPVAESVIKLISSSLTAPDEGQGEAIAGSALNILRAAREAKKNAPPKGPRAPKVPREKKRRPRSR